MRFSLLLLGALVCACTARDDAPPPPRKPADAPAPANVDLAAYGLKFDASYDGGQITLESDSAGKLPTDSARARIALIAQNFSAGNFAIPGLDHSGDVPGLPTMNDLLKRIRFTMDTTPRGAMLHIASADSIAVDAIKDFIEFQRSDYRVGRQKN